MATTMATTMKVQVQMQGRTRVRVARAQVTLMVVLVAAFFAMTIASAASLRSSSRTSSPRATDTMKILVAPTNTTSPPIAPNYIWFSLEQNIAQSWTGYVPGQPRASFVNLMRQLMVSDNQTQGPVFRIGGNSADYSWYNPDNLPFPTNLPGPAFTYNITDAQILSLYNGAKAVDGGLVIGVNFRRPENASWAILHVAALERLIGFDNPVLRGLEIGNEPDEYPNNGIRPSNWTFDDYMNDFGFYAEQLHAAFPSLPDHFFQGAALAGEKPWVRDLPTYVKRFSNEVHNAATHHYPFCNCAPNNVTIVNLLEETAASREAAFLADAPGNIVQEVNALGFPLILGEGNSVCCSGRPNVSDVFGVNLWAVDELYYSANVGLAQWTFHSHDQEPTHYPPLIWLSETSDVPLVQPLYYGLRFFADATANYAQIVESTISTNNEKIRAWATINARGRVTIVVLHKDLAATQPATITVALATGKFQPDAALYLLEAPSVLERYDITYAQQTYDNTQDGMPSGTRTHETVTQASDGSWTFTVDPISAVQLHIHAAADGVVGGEF